MQTAHTLTTQHQLHSVEGCEIQEIGTEAFKVWWESQYDPAESHNIATINMNENIEVVQGTSLELNTIFYELEGQKELETVAMSEGADFTGK